MGLQTLWALLIGAPSAIWLIGLVLWRLGARKPGPQAIPDVSVLVAARNEEQHAGEMLSSALIQNDIGPVPVIVVDDRSTDRTLEIAEAFRALHPSLRIFAAESAHGCPSPKKNALRQGLSHVHTPFVALTDADCRVEPFWISSMGKEIDERVGAVLGASFPPRGETFGEFMYRAERLTANCVMASSCGWGGPSSACGHNLVYRTGALQEAGGFAHSELPSGDDDLTVQAIARIGWKVRFASSPSSVVLDCGGSGRASRWQSASRHQSVLKYYPLRWRALFAWSVTAHIVTLLVVTTSVFGAMSHGAIVGAASLIFLDVSCAVITARKLRLDVTLLEILVGALLLPFWTVWRAASALFGGGYSWRGRSFNASGATGANA